MHAHSMCCALDLWMIVLAYINQSEMQWLRYTMQVCC